jgi:hypothetical protein
MKKSPSKSKKLFGKIPVISLGPSPRGPAPSGLHVAYVTITIDETGALNPPPTLLDVKTGDEVAWLITNNSDRQVRIRNKKFKKNDVELSPIRFINERATAEKNGGTGTISGFVTHLPPGESDRIKYTVEVRGKRDADYDPDLIIRRPPV